MTLFDGEVNHFVWGPAQGLSSLEPTIDLTFLQSSRVRHKTKPPGTRNMDCLAWVRRVLITDVLGRNGVPSIPLGLVLPLRIFYSFCQHLNANGSNILCL